MKIIRIIEVWEKGMDGNLVAHWPVAPTISTAYLQRVFASEQDRPDPDMHLSYMLSQDHIEALQPYVAQPLDASQYDFILSCYGEPEDNTQPRQP